MLEQGNRQRSRQRYKVVSVRMGNFTRKENQSRKNATQKLAFTEGGNGFGNQDRIRKSVVLIVVHM